MFENQHESFSNDIHSWIRQLTTWCFECNKIGYLNKNSSTRSNIFVFTLTCPSLSFRTLNHFMIYVTSTKLYNCILDQNNFSASSFSSVDNSGGKVLFLFLHLNMNLFTRHTIFMNFEILLYLTNSWELEHIRFTSVVYFFSVITNPSLVVLSDCGYFFS